MFEPPEALPIHTLSKLHYLIHELYLTNHLSFLELLNCENHCHPLLSLNPTICHLLNLASTNLILSPFLLKIPLIFSVFPLLGLCYRPYGLSPTLLTKKKSCCFVWGSCGVTTRKTLDKLQNRAIRIITNSAYDVSVGSLLRQSNLSGISDMIKQQSASMVYKAFNTETNLYLKEQVTRVSTIASRASLGSNLGLRPQRLISRHGQSCFTY